MMELGQRCKIEQNLRLSVRALLRERLQDMLELANRHEFSIKVGNSRGIMVVMNPNNVYFIHPKL
jgi:hypothetical protein